MVDRVRAGFLALAALGLGGCGRGDGPRAAAAGACTLGTAHTVARSRAHDFDASALVVRGAAALAVYSDASGSYVQRLSSEGAPLGRPSAIGARCAGGLSTLARADGAWVACLRPGREAALILVVEGADGALAARETHVSSAGSQARGVSLVRHERGLALAHHDASALLHRAWLTRLSEDGRPRGPSEPLGPPGAVVEDPALFSDGGALYATYASWELRPEASRTTLHIEQVGGRAHLRIPIQHEAPTGRLALHAGQLVLSYRERPSPRARVEHFLLQLSPALAVRGTPVRIGRATGEHGPALAGCGETLFAASPIEHGSELYVIFHALDAALAARDPNHQCYATNHSYVSAASACSGDGLLALVGEQTDPSGAPAELLGMRFSCAQ